MDIFIGVVVLSVMVFSVVALLLLAQKFIEERIIITRGEALILVLGFPTTILALLAISLGEAVYWIDKKAGISKWLNKTAYKYPKEDESND